MELLNGIGYKYPKAVFAASTPNAAMTIGLPTTWETSHKIAIHERTPVAMLCKTTFSSSSIN